MRFFDFFQIGAIFYILPPSRFGGAALFFPLHLQPIPLALAIDSGSSQCACGNSPKVESLHRKSIKAGMEIAGIEIVELQIYDAHTKKHVEKKPYILVINNGIHATKIDEQDESLLCPIQARYHGSIFDDSSHSHDENQRLNASETSIPIKSNRKHMHTYFTKATKHERETLPVEKLAGSSRLTPPQPNDDFKSIRNLKIKPHHFDNLKYRMSGM